MSKTVTIETEFERLDLLKQALDRLGVSYQENAAVPGMYYATRADIAINGSEFAWMRGIGYKKARRSGQGIVRVQEDIDAGCSFILDFEARLHNAYNYALCMEALEPAIAQGLQVQESVLEDGTILLDVVDPVNVDPLTYAEGVI